MHGETVEYTVKFHK